jgi:8-oxo-dGTP diphosphatase
MPFTYEFPRPAVTVDCVIFGYDGKEALKVLLIQRKHDPYAGQWALPGGFVDMDEPLETAALRELEEETSVKDVFVEQLYTFGEPGRDPRGRMISVAYFALVDLASHPIQAADDARAVNWFPIEDLPDLAFDHRQIIDMAIDRLRSKVRYQPIGFELLPSTFTLTQLQDLYEVILGLKAKGKSLNKRNFRTRILKMNVLEEAGKQEGVSHRPATLYRFDQQKYEQLRDEKHPHLLRRGIDFDV